MRKRIFPVVLLALALAGSHVVVAHADSGYMIPLEGGRWGTYRISIGIPSNPAWEQLALLDAINVWNQSQSWFADTYYPGGKLYTFVQLPPKTVINSPDELPLVTVSFSNVTSVNRVGEVDMTLSPSKAFTSSVLVLPRSYMGQVLNSSYSPWFTRLALHTLGHVLGLDEVQGFCDLMEGQNSSCRVASPSTLDLYALHILAGGSMPSNVTLPRDIPYQETPATAVPEFSVTGPTLILALLSALILWARVRRTNYPVERQALGASDTRPAT